MDSPDAPSLAKEFGWMLRERRAQGQPDPVRPVVHVSLSFAPEDRRLSHAELSLIAEEFITRMGYDGVQYVAVEHNDRQHQHLHVVLSRVRLDGSLVRHALGDYSKAMAVCRDLEREHGLREVVPELGRHQATRDEYRDAQRTGQPSERRRLQALVLTAMAGGPTLGQFVARLERQGVEVRLRRAADGPVLGISYRLDRFAFRGSALGDAFTWSALSQHQVNCDPVRDRALIDRLSRTHVPLQAPDRSGIEERARKLIDQLLAGRPTLPELVASLAANSVGVRLNVARTGHVSGISYDLDGRLIKGSALGRDYSWHSLKRRGLRYEPVRDHEFVHSLSRRGPTVDDGRDAETLRLTAVLLPEGLAARERPTSRPEDLAAMREVLRAAVAGRPTLSEFVERVESEGVEVRLYGGHDGKVYAIGFGLGRVSVNARELGETFTWQGLQSRGVEYDPERDRRTVDQVGHTLALDDPRCHDLLGTVGDIAQAARTAKRRLEQAAEIIEDPISALAHIGSEAAMRAVLKALSEGLQAAGRAAAQRLAERQDELLRDRDRELLARARQERADRDPGPSNPTTPVTPPTTSSAPRRKDEDQPVLQPRTEARPEQAKVPEQLSIEWRSAEPYPPKAPEPRKSQDLEGATPRAQREPAASGTPEHVQVTAPSHTAWGHVNTNRGDAQAMAYRPDPEPARPEHPLPPEPDTRENRAAPRAVGHALDRGADRPVPETPPTTEVDNRSGQVAEPARHSELVPQARSRDPQRPDPPAWGTPASVTSQPRWWPELSTLSRRPARPRPRPPRHPSNASTRPCRR